MGSPGKEPSRVPSLPQAPSAEPPGLSSSADTGLSPSLHVLQCCGSPSLWNSAASSHAQDLSSKGQQAGSEKGASILALKPRHYFS